MADWLVTGTVAQAIRDRLNTQFGVSLALVLCQVGDLFDYPASADLEADAPFIVVRPMNSEVQFGPGIGDKAQVIDHFRIVYGRKFEGAAGNPIKNQMTDIKSIVDELRASFKPTWITSVLPAGLSLRVAAVRGIEWERTEEELTVTGADVRVAAILYDVHYARL